MQRLSDCYTLHNGVLIPCVGFGTWRMEDETAQRSVQAAVAAGYRHIDTAEVYENEAGVGAGVKSCGLARDELFITTKLCSSRQGYQTTLEACKDSLKRMGLDYLDLYLIHCPIAKKYEDCWQETIAETWRAFETLYRDGIVRTIGVSNFEEHHFQQTLEKTAIITPMVNQIQIHPGVTRDKTRSYCREQDILVEAWSPLGSGEMLSRPLLAELAEKYEKSPAQICLRWNLQSGILPLPKSTAPARIEANGNIFDFELTDEDMTCLDRMDYDGFVFDSDQFHFE